MSHLQHKRKAFQSGGTPFDTTDLIAWYDFDDSGGDGNLDNHGAYDWTEANTPTWDTGSPNHLITTGSTTDAHLTMADTGLGTDWVQQSDGDRSLVLRFRAHSTGATRYALYIGNRAFVNVNDTDLVFRMIQASSVTVSFAHATAWVWFYVGLNPTTPLRNYNINGGAVTGTNSQAAAANTRTAYVGGDSATNIQDMDIDYMGFFNRVLTADEQTFLYNSGGTLAYSGGTIVQV